MFCCVSICSFIFPLWQRPRKVGAKFTGTGMAPDEHDQITLDMDYDGKRDRWNGYDPEDHMRIVEEYSKVDLVSHITYPFPYNKLQWGLNGSQKMKVFLWIGDGVSVFSRPQRDSKNF